MGFVKNQNGTGKDRRNFVKLLCRHSEGKVRLQNYQNSRTKWSLFSFWAYTEKQLIYSAINKFKIKSVNSQHFS